MEIMVRNVEEAWARWRDMFAQNELATLMTRKVSPRGMATLEIQQPVATYYSNPTECVLFDPVRDCNPFFHLYEAIWMLAGRNDVERVKTYSKQIAAYSDDATVFHGAYGTRWRRWFAAPGDYGGPIDQLPQIVSQLKRDPDSRRAVLQMWDADTDLNGNGLDVPCNTNAYFRVYDRRLEMTVCNRSNDAVWGCYGANAVHFSFLQQYLARQLNVEVGRYVQFSNSLHVYLDGVPGAVWTRIVAAGKPNLWQSYDPYVHYGVYYTPHDFALEDAEVFTQEPTGVASLVPHSKFLTQVAGPMCMAFQIYKTVGAKDAYDYLFNMPRGRADMRREAWIEAGLQWLVRRTHSKGGQR